MISELKLIPILVDGCAAGVVDEEGTPIFKPWRVMVSHVHLAAAIGGFKCSGDHLHGRCDGGQKVAQTAYYPWRLCEAIHKGFDSHEVARALCSPCFSAGPADGAFMDGARQPSEAAGLRLDRREAVHIGHAPGRVDGVPVPDNTEGQIMLGHCARSLHT